MAKSLIADYKSLHECQQNTCKDLHQQFLQKSFELMKERNLVQAFIQAREEKNEEIANKAHSMYIDELYKTKIGQEFMHCMISNCDKESRKIYTSMIKIVDDSIQERGKKDSKIKFKMPTTPQLMKQVHHNIDELKQLVKSKKTTDDNYIEIMKLLRKLGKYTETLP